MTTHRLIPTFILQKLATGEHHGRFQATTLFVDISGFTAVTEALMQHGKVGAERLADSMRTVFTPLIDAIYAHDGFVTGFAGDAFTAVFPGRGQSSRLRGVRAAWAIQQAMRAQTVQTEYGRFNFQAKVGIGSGSVTWIIAGADDQLTFALRGPAIDHCATAEHLAQPGEIVAQLRVVASLPAVVQAEPLADPRHVRLTRVTPLDPAPAPPPPPPVDLRLARRFVPADLLTTDMRGEFRQVVSLFINVKGTPTRPQLTELLQSLFHLLSIYDGYLCRLDFGDKGCNLLLFWGAPAAHENDLSRALNFILDLRQQTAVPLRAGVTYRQVFAGFAGSERREEYTCYGRAVNLAARLMMAAPWGAVWLDALTARWATSFTFTVAEPVQLRGFAQPQLVHTLNGRLDDQRFAYRGTFVGREAALSRLVDTLSVLENGRFAGVTVVTGDAGIGKSRLLHEAYSRHQLEHHSQIFLGQTDEILRRPLNSFRYWLRTYFNQSHQQTEKKNKAAFDRKLATLLGQTSVVTVRDELERTRSFLGSLVDLRWPNSLYEQVEPQLRLENSFIAIKSLLRAEALRQPVVLLLEDAQWLDEASKQLLPQLSRNMEQVPLAIWLSSRAAGTLDLFSQQTAVQHIQLEQLSDAQITTIAQDLLGASPSTGLIQMLQNRAEGNPFFLEQILLFLREEGLLTETAVGLALNEAVGSTLPDTVQAVLIARLDQLTRSVREVVQTAAVLGREFEVRVLSQMLQNRDGLTQQIAAAEKAAVWSALSELNYLFRHALLRDAAYEMQLEARRRELHRLAGEAIEQQYEADKRPYLADLVYHYNQAQNSTKERDYAHQQGDEAANQFANTQAITAYSRALELAEDDLSLQIELLVARGKVFKLVGDLTSWEADIAHLNQLLPQIENIRQRAHILLAHANFAEISSDYATSIGISRQILTSLPDTEPYLLILAYQQLGRSLIDTAEHEQAKEAFYTSLGLAREHHYLPEEANALFHLGSIFDDQKQFEDAQSLYLRALTIYEQINDRRGQCVLINNLGVTASNLNDTEMTLTYYEKALAIADEIGYRRASFVISGNVANQKALKGLISEALTFMEQSLTLTREMGYPRDEARLLNNIGFLYTELGQYDIGESYLRQAMNIRQQIGVRRSVGSSHLNLALLAIRRAQYAQAESICEQAVSLAQDIQDDNGVVQAMMFRGIAQLRQEKWREAEETFRQTMSETEKINQTEGGAVVESLCGLAQIAWERGDRETAVLHIERCLNIFDQTIPYDLINPRRIRWHAYQILRHTQPQRAHQILQSIVQEINDFARNIERDDYRQSYLENVTLNRQILAAWQNQTNF